MPAYAGGKNVFPRKRERFVFCWVSESYGAGNSNIYIIVHMISSSGQFKIIWVCVSSINVKINPLNFKQQNVTGVYLFPEGRIGISGTRSLRGGGWLGGYVYPVGEGIYPIPVTYI